MLQSLKIQNIALIPQVEIEFGGRFNVLSGETGAGKSIILGSFNFILGEKLNKTVIRQGAAFAKVDAVFTVVGAELRNITERTGIEFPENTVIVTRILKADGKSECRINGDIVTIAVLKDVASFLINIHGQHEHETLLKTKNHLTILDGFGGSGINSAKAEYFSEYDKLQKLKSQLKSFGGSDAERDRLIDMYQYQIGEIERARLRDGEDEELNEYKQKMLNFEKIHANLNAAVQVFNAEEGGISDAFKKLLSALNTISGLDTKVERIAESARSVQYDLEDINDTIQSYLDSLEYDEEKFREVDARLDEIKILKRKYGSSVAEIFTFLHETRANLEFLNRSAEDIEKVKKQIAAQENAVRAEAAHLTEVRKGAAQKLEAELVAQLKDLGMPSCRFAVHFEEITAPTLNGVDEVEFLFSANAGVEMQPLADIISGGEMSRFMLALKTVTARIDNISTLVFDEIDTGIGGTMGTNIATKMAVLSKLTQIIVVTHLPQIAAMADTHFLIEKTESGNKTTTSINKLDRDGQVAELARMLGGGGVSADGVTLTDSAREHATAMKKWSDEYKATTHN